MATWALVEGFSGYEVSDTGMVRNAETGYVLTQGATEKGYRVVGLHRDGERLRRKVHRLVARAFVGPIPEGMHVCHNNGVPNDNRACNLRIDTPSENSRDIVRMGRHEHANKTHCVNGHAFDAQNTRYRINARNGRTNRVCVACVTERGRKRHARRSAPHTDRKPTNPAPTQGGRVFSCMKAE